MHMEDALRDALSAGDKDNIKENKENTWNSYIPSTKIG